MSEMRVVNAEQIANDEPELVAKQVNWHLQASHHMFVRGMSSTELRQMADLLDTFTFTDKAQAVVSGTYTVHGIVLKDDDLVVYTPLMHPTGRE